MRGDVPSAVALTGGASKRHFIGALGVTSFWKPAPVERETIYDLASLTKVVATLPAVLKLVGMNEFGLGARVGSFFSNAGWLQSPSLADATVGELLAHTSGLPAWRPLFAWAERRETAIANVLQTELARPGSYLYSDLGFIALGAIVERVTGERLDAFVQAQLFKPLGMTSTRFGPIAAGDVAATEDCSWRNERLQGVVHDENAYILNGVAGHAGLFGSADDLATYAQAWLELDDRLAPAELLRLATSERLRSGNDRRGLGWVLWTESSSAGRYASPAAYGHTGFTGTSLWIDPARDWFAVLLTNRVHPVRGSGEAIHALRVAFHEALLAKEPAR
jgi:serine-type D-Ala-D-Ala carboxypeptidase